MKVEIWSDFVCPFCYIGKRRFEAALKQYVQWETVELVYRSFELDPHAKRDHNPEIHEMLADKYGISREQAAANTEKLKLQAQEIGLEFNFHQTIQTNTHDAHRLSHYAAAEGKHDELTERLMKAYFTDGLHIGDHRTLAELAAEIGLEYSAAFDVLTNGTYAENVRVDQQQAGELGVRGVPYFLINRKYAISGAQSSETFERALGEVRNKK